MQKLVVLLLVCLLAVSFAAQANQAGAATKKTQESAPANKTQATATSTRTQEFNFDALKDLQQRDTAQVLKNRTYVDNKMWKYAPHLGLRFISEYYVTLHYFGLENTTVFNTTTYKRIALAGQMENGSWKQLEDPMVKDGQIDSTILAYWALKVMGEDLNSPHMKKAREWILNYGGIEKSSTLTKYFLCLFGQYDWENLLYIPLMVLRNDSYFAYSYADNFVGQWVTPHLVAMAYLRHYKIGKNMGPRFSMQELYPDGPQEKFYNVPKPEQPDFDTLNTVEKELDIQQHNGGFGAYTVSSLFNMAALQDFDKHYPGIHTDKIKIACKKAFDFLEFTYITAPDAGYKGMLMDGTWWDNTLIVNGMAEAGVPVEKLYSTMDHIVQEGQQANGGFCYGYGFEYAPDTDDTALAVQAMIKLNRTKYAKQIEKAVQWTLEMQNKDGGFGAFHKEKNINPIIAVLAGKIADSAEIFDQSSVDLAAHVLGAWADYGLTCEHPQVQRGIAYMKKQQYYFGSWEARWATNYIHNAGYVVYTLSKLGCDVSESWIKKAVAWALSKQNEDGGWGESYMSYHFGRDMEGVGVSTPTHTSWVLFGLLEIADHKDYDVTNQIFKAMNYLMAAHKKHGQFIDETPVGTGHRGILTMQYPAYAKAFPNMVISRFLKKFGDGKTCSETNNYCRKVGVDSYCWEGPDDEL